MYQLETANNSITSEPLGYKHTLRFDDDIVQPSQYRSEMYILENAQESDKIELRVNTCGGSAYTGIALVNKIFNCKVPVHGIIEAEASSCGSLIWLACHTHEWGVATKLMIHSGGTVSGGTPTNTIKGAESYKKQMRELFETVYEGFVTEEELDKIIEDDFQLDINSDEIQERLDRMYSHRQNLQDQYHKEVDDALWEENERFVAELLEKIDISEEHKEIFLDVKQKVDDASMIPDVESIRDLSGELSDSIQECSESCEDELTKWSVLQLTDNISLHWINAEEMNPEVVIQMEDDEDGIILRANPNLLTKADRGDIVHVLSEVDDCSSKSLLKMNTDKLINKFVKRVYEIIGEEE